jgi:hypothetical protein
LQQCARHLEHGLQGESIQSDAHNMGQMHRKLIGYKAPWHERQGTCYRSETPPVREDRNLAEGAAVPAVLKKRCAYTDKKLRLLPTTNEASATS